MEPIYIAGATASGKSAVAMILAERLGGEIISVDSMQVYRGLNMGTAKPTHAERACVPHHMIDVAEPNHPFDVAQYIHLASEASRDITKRGRIPVYCGGTGLYFNALISGVGVGPPSNLALRAELESTPLPALLEELAKADPETFARIDRSNPRRIIRALEVMRSTQQPYSLQRAHWKKSVTGHWFGLARERADLIRRIDARVERMFAAGLVEETVQLLQQGLKENRTAMQAIGYRQVVEHLDGMRDLRATIQLIKQKTRQFAKRQGTWFRNQLELQWIEVQENSMSDEIAKTIISRVKDPG